MTITQDAQNAVSQLTASVEYEALLPIRKALDRLQQLEHEQATLLNREVIARELFIGAVHGSVRDDLTKAWKNYLSIEAAGFPKGSVNPSEVLAKYRAEADHFVSVLRSTVAYV